MPFSISVVHCVGCPSSSMLSEPRRLGNVPLSTTVHLSLATRRPIRPLKALVFLRLKSASRPCPMASCSRMPGQPGPSTTSISPAGQGRAASCCTASRAACSPRLSGVNSWAKNSSGTRPPPPAWPFSVTPFMLAKLALVRRAEQAARGHDPRIVQVRVGYADELRRVWVVSSDGRSSSDAQPLARLSVFCLARENGVTEKGHAGGGGRVPLEFFDHELTPESLGEQAAREAVQQLAARPCPAGEMEVVLGPGWPGILLHEAIGHGLEADFNRKKTSAF